MINEDKFKKMEARERVAFLRAHADTCESREVPIPLDPDDRAQSEHKVTQMYVKMKGLTEKKKEIVKDFNTQIRDIRDGLNLLADEVKTGNRIEERQVFSVLNEDTGMIEEYTEDGLLLSSRRAPKHYQQGLRPVHQDRAINED